METEAATPTGGAETSARPDVSAEKPSVHERLKSFLNPEPEKPKPQVARAETNPEPTEEVETPEQEEEPAKPQQDEPEEDAQPEETDAEPETLDELAERLGWDLDKILNLKAKTKIDGKEGTQLLRDLLKSHQLEGHLNQKLMAFADEKKAFETERQTHVQQQQHKLMQLDAGLQVAQKLLEGEFAGINWQQLQDQDPLEFNQKYVAFQQRQAQLNHIAGMLGQERQKAQEAEASQMQSYLGEQSKLLETKVPEWADSKIREREIAEMAVELNQAYGVTEQELKALRDHREVLIARDAWQWRKLQKAKPAIVNKVKAAPKLIKPGTPQSRAASDSLALKGERERLRSTGKVGDAAKVFKRLGIV